MSLGKRYIPVFSGTEVSQTMHKEPYDMPFADDRMLEVDLEDLPDVDASLDEQHQHAERMATKWLARYKELSAEVGRVPGTCEAVPVEKPLGPYVTYHAWPLRREGGQHVGTPTPGVLAVHSSGVAAVSTDERSQMANKQAALERVRQLLTANAGRQR